MNRLPRPVSRNGAYLALLLSAGIAPAGCHEPPDPFVRHVEDFQLDEPSDAWRFRTPDLWRIEAEGPRRVMKLTPPPNRPGVERPTEYAVHTRHLFTTFSLSVRARLDAPPVPTHRGLCLIFGWQDDTHFYYLEFSPPTADAHDALVRVDGHTRTALLSAHEKPKPVFTDNAWHKVDILRNADTGSIAVYVDAYEPGAEPWLTASDKTYPSGHVGLGSFDRQATFAHLLIEGRAHTGPRIPSRPLADR